MPSTSLEIIVTKKSSAEDSSSKWEDNKNKSLKTGPVSETLKDNLEDQDKIITEINSKEVSIGQRNLNNLKLNTKLKAKKLLNKPNPNHKSNPKSKKKSRSSQPPKNLLKNRVKLSLKLKPIIKSHNIKNPIMKLKKKLKFMRRRLKVM